MKGNKIIGKGDTKKIPNCFKHMVPPNPMAKFSIRLKPEKPNK